jgi:4-amino-4-deoxy-L-arabinose transferase-like glycosyltransferase
LSARAAALLANRRATRDIALALLALALLLRVATIEHYHYTPINDGESYLKGAFAISKYGTYHDGNHAAGGARGPSAYFPPAFSYLLSVVDKLTGGPALGATTVHLARLVQALLGTVTVGLIGLVALELFGVGTALLALALAAVYPVFLEDSSVLVAENLLTVLELAAVYAALRARRSAVAMRWVIGIGVLIGLAALTHTNAALIVIPLGFAVKRAQLPQRFKRLPARAARIAAPATLLVVALLTVTPWLIRDAVVFHHFVPISTENGITLAGTYNPTSAVSDPTYRWIYYGGVPSLQPIQHEARHLTEIQLGDRLEHKALSYIGQHPLAPLSVAFHNTLRLLELEGSLAWKESSSAIGLDIQFAQIGVDSFWLLLAVALAGLATRPVRRALRRVPRWFWGVPLVMWLTVVLVNAETPRFREPLDPFLILLAAVALASAASRLAAARRPVAPSTPASARPGSATGTA